MRIKLMRIQMTAPLLAAFLLLLTAAAQAGDFRVVAGQRIGTVVLGMDRPSVHTLLHSPSATRRLPNGVILDTWLSPQLLTPGFNQEQGLKHNYLSVFFRHGHAVQIAVTSPQFTTASGLSTRHSAHDFAKHYPDYTQPHRQRYAPGPNGLGPLNYGPISPDSSSPAGKHFVLYGDAIKKGLAWKYGAWGNLAPDPDPNRPLEAVIVHLPGQVVLLNPNDGLPYAGTAPARKVVDQ